jgi:hypothetical protein
MLNISIETGAVGTATGASIKIMWLIAAPAPTNWGKIGLKKVISQ